MVHNCEQEPGTNVMFLLTYPTCRYDSGDFQQDNAVVYAEHSLVPKGSGSISVIPNAY